MRTCLLVMFVSFACSTSRLNSDVQTIRKREHVPISVESGLPHAVTVFVEATCGHLDRATAHFVGFWVTPGVVVTAGHAMFARRHMFPDFALLSPDGTCVDGQYGSWHDSVELLFILSSGNHGGALELAKRLPAPGEPAYQISHESAGGHSVSSSFRTHQVTIERRADSRVFFGAKPIPRSVDSGSPLLDENGKVLGMAIAIGSDNDAPEKMGVGIYLNSLTISSLLDACCQREK